MGDPQLTREELLQSAVTLTGAVERLAAENVRLSEQRDEANGRANANWTGLCEARNVALEEAACVAEGFARANINLNPNEQEATIASSVSQAVANAIRLLK